MESKILNEICISGNTYRVGDYVVIAEWNYVWCQENRVARIDGIEVDRSHFYEYEDGNKDAPIRICIPDVILRHATGVEIRSEMEKREKELIMNVFK
jgi:hypothetical protein